MSKARRRWHKHVDVKCIDCGAVVWPSVTCVTRKREWRCMVPRVTRCEVHERLAKRQQALEVAS